MVKYLIYLFLWLPPLLFSAEFTANVNRNQINAGESFILNLTLKEASAQNPPSIDDLKQSFFIHSQQHASNIVMTNGRITSSTSWKIVLTPQKEGEIIIPSISINTSEGTFSSQPITMNVIKGNSSASDTSDINGLTLTTDVSKAKPYKNEPIFYTVKLSSRLDLVNVKIQKFNMEDAIIEPNGEPKVYKKVVDGINVNVIELSYLMTPLKTGLLKIPSFAIQGEIPMKRQSATRSSFDDDFEPFFMLSGFDRLKPFMLTTQEEVLDVQPAIAGVTPWLAAQSVKIEEIWDEAQTLQVGEPIIRSLKIVAKGILSNQLPSLNEQQMGEHHFKIYADKPEMRDEIKDENIYSSRQEQYTLIPQQSGVLTLPEISVIWWDVTKNEKALALLPSRKLEILPSPENTKSHISLTDEEKSTLPASQDISIQNHAFLYALIAGLVALLFAVFFWVIALQKKIRRLAEPSAELRIASPKEKSRQSLYSQSKQKLPGKDKKEKLPDLNPT